MPRSCQVNLRLTVEELELIRELADADGASVSGWIRAAVLGKVRLRRLADKLSVELARQASDRARADGEI